MLRSLKSILGYSQEATDGPIGAVDDFYFDDQEWTVRYLVARTGSWLLGRQVLIAPSALDQPDWMYKKLPINHTIEEIKNSPEADLDMPVSRQHEADLHRHFGWIPYWGPYGTTTSPGVLEKAQADLESEPSEVERGDSHLRSLKEVLHYDITCGGERNGAASDFIFEDHGWLLHYLIAKIGPALSRRQVMIPVHSIARIDWDSSTFVLDMTEDELESQPDYDPNAPINAEFILKYFDYRGRPRTRA